MALTATGIRNARPKRKPYRLYDEKGLYLDVRPSGSKYWRFKYRFAGVEKLLALGVYPEVKFKEARDRRDEARRMLADGVDPSAHKQEVRRARLLGAENSFEVVAREWFERQAPGWAESHSVNVIGRLERDVFPTLGRRPIHEIAAPELLGVLLRVEKRGAAETARRLRQVCGQVFRYGIATGRAQHDIAADLRGALATGKVKHHASITEPKAVGALMRAIESYEGTLVTQCALQLAPRVFVRPGELQGARWSEFDLDSAEWRIPTERMKAREAHLVPLSKQAVEILHKLEPLTGHGTYVFPSNRSSRRPISNNTINAALRRMGYPKEEMTGHGFRSMASTLLHEQGWAPDVIERQLAHAERNAVRAAYNYAEHLPERRRMMQAWSDYLDDLATRAGSTHRR